MIIAIIIIMILITMRVMDLLFGVLLGFGAGRLLV